MEFIGPGSETKHANRDVLQLFSLPKTYTNNEFQIRVTREIVTGQTNVASKQLPGIKMHPSRQLVARFTKFHNHRGTVYSLKLDEESFEKFRPINQVMYAEDEDIDNCESYEDLNISLGSKIGVMDYKADFLQVSDEEGKDVQLPFYDRCFYYRT